MMVASMTTIPFSLTAVTNQSKFIVGVVAPLCGYRFQLFQRTGQGAVFQWLEALNLEIYKSPCTLRITRPTPPTMKPNWLENFFSPIP